MSEDELEPLLATWEERNIRSYSRHSPAKDETILRLYMACINEHVKPFTTTNFMTKLMQRQSRWVSFGTTCDACGRKTRIIFMWETPQVVEAENRAMGSETAEAVEEIL